MMPGAAIVPWEAVGDANAFPIATARVVVTRRHAPRELASTSTRLRRNASRHDAYVCARHAQRRRAGARPRAPALRRGGLAARRLAHGRGCVGPAEGDQPARG